MVSEFQRRRDLIVNRLNGMGYETVNAHPNVKNVVPPIKRNA